MLSKIVKLRLRFLINTNLYRFYHPFCCQHRVDFLSKLSSGAVTSRTRFESLFSHISQPRFHFLEIEKLSYGAQRHLSGLTRRKSTREYSSSTTETIHYNLSPDVPKSEGRKLFFDTHAVVRLLENNGFKTEQAEVIVNVLVQMTNSNMDVIYSDMVTKVQQEIMLQRVMSQIATVKKDMIILEKSEFSTLLAENEKLKIQLLQFKVQLAKNMRPYSERACISTNLTLVWSRRRPLPLVSMETVWHKTCLSPWRIFGIVLFEDIMNKVRFDSLLDMNLEKSQVKELKAEHEKKLLETRTEIMEMTAEHERHLTQTNMKIDTEVAGLKTMLESHKLDTIKYLAGSVFTCLTVVLGFYRIWM